MLVDHALAKFSTDNLSVMVVRFDSKKVRENTSIDIGVEHDAHKKGEVSEAEMIVEQARRNSGIPPDGITLTESEKEDLNNMAEEEAKEKEAGPELTPEGQALAQRTLEQNKAASGTSDGKALV